MTAQLDRLARAWWQPVGSATRSAALALLVGVVLSAAHLARLGTWLTRGGAAAAVLAALLVIIARAMRRRRDALGGRRTIERVLLPSQPELGRRALRAWRLVERTETDATSGSPDLARLHLERLILRASLDAVDQTAARRARRWRLATLMLTAGSAVVLALSPINVAEGLDVLLARHGRAPAPMTFVELVRVSAQPPAYLRSAESSLALGFSQEEALGSVLRVEAVPIRSGRTLVLSDGISEVPFVSDGAGGVVATWKLERDARLRVAARFGDVLIEQADEIDVGAEPDAPPRVVLEGAPKTVQLSELELLELRYVAYDDHGLRQIDLVLRSGGREERRMLTKLDGEKTVEHGAHALPARDPFLAKMFLPIVITVEARDDNNLKGQSWGSSKPITVLPPVVGEPQARRYIKLAEARDKAVDYIAWLLQDRSSLSPDELADRRRSLSERAMDAIGPIELAVEQQFAGVRVPFGLKEFLLAQARQLAPKGSEVMAPPWEPLQTRATSAVLAMDAVLQALASRDAQTVAKQLGEVAEEAAMGALYARENENRKPGLDRLDAAALALKAGAEELILLGPLGLDLGTLTRSELRRIERARQRLELSDAELAARHLAARLKRPNPSFGTPGGRGGVESGAPMGSSRGTSGRASHADQRFDELANELAQLAEDHAGEIDRVSRALDEADQSASLPEELRNQARERAQALRQALSDLPQRGPTGSARSSAALAGDHGNAMAENLERLALSDALQSGREALGAIDRARDQLRANPDEFLDPHSLETVRQQLKSSLDWAERVQKELERTAEAAARAKLQPSGVREQELARRAKELLERDRKSGGVLPHDAAEGLDRAEIAMRQAARELKDGSGERGKQLQQEAQRWLERSATGRTTDEPEPSSRDSVSGDPGKAFNTKGEVPAAGSKDRARDFRQRVLEGLKQRGGGRLAPAIERYAEGLLQ